MRRDERRTPDPVGHARPTDPVERAWATGIERDGDHYTLAKPVDWSKEGVRDELRDAEDRER
jgi:hypothetical protein